MKKQHPEKTEEESEISDALGVNDEDQSHEIKIPFNYTCYWPYIDSEFFSDIIKENLLKLNQYIFEHSKLSPAKKPKKSRFDSSQVFPFPTESEFLKLNEKNFITLKIGVSANKNEIHKSPWSGKPWSLEKEIAKIKEYLDKCKLNKEGIMSVLLDNIDSWGDSEISTDKTLSLHKGNLFYKKRLHLLSNEIYTWQLRQFAESIQRIQINKKRNEYTLTFDPCSKLKRVKLNKTQFKNLIHQRIIMNCPPCTEAFLTKGDSKHRDDTTDIFDQSYKNSKYTQIGEFKLPKYQMCHHCKLQKSKEDLFKCQMNNIGNTWWEEQPKKETKIYIINQTITVRKDNKNYFLKNYKGGLRELIDDYFNPRNNCHQGFHLKQVPKRCEESYCESCWKLFYNHNNVKEEKDSFICPKCNEGCSCSRCFREEQLIKIIAYYLSINGNIEQWYTFLQSKDDNGVINEFKDNWVLSNFMIFNFENKKFQNDWFKDLAFERKQVIDYSRIWTNYQDYFSENFLNAWHNSELLEVDKNINNIISDDKTSIKSVYLNRKRSKHCLIEKGETEMFKGVIFSIPIKETETTSSSNSSKRKNEKTKKRSKIGSVKARKVNKGKRK